MVYLTTLKEELVRYGALDPEQVEEKKKGVLLAKEAAFRWTGNRLSNYLVLIVAHRSTP
jgi:hypothetical protein